MDDMREELMRGIDYDDDERIYLKGNARAGFEKALAIRLVNKTDILVIFENGFGGLIQRTLNRYVVDFAGSMPAGSIDRCKLHFISGALANVLIQWLSEGAKEPPRDIASICAECLTGRILR